MNAKQRTESRNNCSLFYSDESEDDFVLPTKYESVL